MITQVRLHLKYLFNKFNVRAFLILSLIIISLTIYMSQTKYVVDLSDAEKYHKFSSNLIVFHKAIILLYSTLFFSMNFQNSSDSLRSLLVRPNNGRGKYLSAKLLTLSIQIIMIWAILLLTYCVTSAVSFRSFTLNGNLVMYFLSLLVFGLNFGLLSVIFVLVIPSEYSTIIVIIISLGTEIVGQASGSLAELTKFIMPVLIEKDYLVFASGLLYNLALGAMYYCLSHIIYMRRDLF